MSGYNHTLDVEHRRRVQLLRKRADEASSVQCPTLDDMFDPDISVRLAARAAAAAVHKPKLARMDEELTYMINAGPVLMKYYDLQGADSGGSSISASKNSILKYFLPDTVDRKADGAKTQLLREYERATRQVTEHDAKDDDVCPFCGGEGMTLVAEEAVKICRRCDACVPAVVETERPPSKDTVKDSTAFCYKRLNHFNEWLAQIQGKQQTNIPDDVYDSILLELKKMKVTNLQDVTCATVKQILRRCRNQKWYEHVTLIVAKLTGKPPRQLHPDLEEQLRTMFRQIQAPFVQHAPSSRTNFLSYSYVLFKLVQLLGYDELLSSFSLLKSSTKLRQQDEVWQKICNCPQLQWEFVPSL